MIPLQSWLDDEHGFTLAELLVVTAVLGLLMAGVFAIQQGGQQAYLLGSNRVETQQNARVALDLMTRELRTATSITTITSGTDLTFLDQCGNSVQYSLSGTSLNRTAPSYSSLCVSTGSSTWPIIDGVQTLVMTYYSVYDVYSGTYTTTTCGTAINLPSCPSTSLTKVIKISIVTKVEDGAACSSPGAPGCSTMESTIRLRATLS